MFHLPSKCFWNVKNIDSKMFWMCRNVPKRVGQLCLCVNMVKKCSTHYWPRIASFDTDFQCQQEPIQLQYSDIWCTITCTNYNVKHQCSQFSVSELRHECRKWPKSPGFESCERQVLFYGSFLSTDYIKRLRSVRRAVKWKEKYLNLQQEFCFERHTTHVHLA